MQMFRKYPSIWLCLLVVSAIAAAWSPTAVSAQAGPEGVAWQLIDVGGAAVAPLAGARQPSLTLDAAQKRATGHSGCNEFIGSYRLAGASLTFGPLGATRRACPEPEADVELAFLQAMERTQSWTIRDSALLLLDGDKVLARFLVNAGGASRGDRISRPSGTVRER